MELLALFLLSAFICAVVASNKGRNVLGWFLLGLIIGPFAIIFALVVSTNQEIVEQNSIKSGSSRKCPFCAELIKNEAIKCRHCGSEVPTTIDSEENKPKYELPPGPPPATTSEKLIVVGFFSLLLVGVLVFIKFQ